MLRLEMVGVRFCVSVVSLATWLTSCSMSMTTMPPALTRGVTDNKTPVLRYSILLMTVDTPVVACCCWVVIGTSSPTSMLAV